MNRRCIHGLQSLLLGLLILTGAASSAEEANPYIVREGDTLWGIARRFLNHPERWPNLWEQNQQIGNPHLIYPGDKIYYYVDADGSPRLRVNQPPPESQEAAGVDQTLVPTIYISPPVRQEEVLSNRQKEIIRQFLHRHSLIADAALQGNGYIIAQSDGHQVIGPGDRVFIKYSKPLEVGDSLSIYRSADPLVGPKGTAPLGHVIQHMGMVQVERMTEQGVMAIVTKAFDIVEPGDRLTALTPINNEFNLYANSPVTLTGDVVHIFDRLEQAGTNQIITIGVGRVHKATQGLIMNIMRAGREVPDPLTPPNWARGDKPVRLPSQRIATAALIYVGEQASFALLTHAEQPVQKGDKAFTH